MKETSKTITTPDPADVQLFLRSEPAGQLFVLYGLLKMLLKLIPIASLLFSRLY
jgi:hypothetical protein